MLGSVSKVEFQKKFQSFLTSDNPQVKAIIEAYKDRPELLTEVFGSLIEEMYEEINPYKYEPVDPRVFLEDGYYGGKNKDTGEGVFETMYPKLKEDFVNIHNINSIYREVILGGCVDIDSLIQEADGGLPTLRERLGKDKPVLVLKNGIEISETVNTRHSGIQKVHKITLENGMSLRLTSDHKVQCYKNKETWIQTKDLKVGINVYVPRFIKTNPSSNISEIEAKLHAYILTNGCFDKYRFRYNSANEATVLDVKECFEKIGFSGTISQKNGAYEFHSTNFVRSGFRDWLNTHSQKYSHGIFVPPEVCKASNEIVAKFLNCVFGAEGCVSCNPEKSPPSIQLSMIDERFIRQVQLLLLRFGVQSKVIHLRQYDKRVNKERFIWNLIIRGIDNFYKFFSNIGFVIGKEQKSKEIKQYCDEREPNTNSDLLPFRIKNLKKYLDLSGLSIDYVKHNWLYKKEGYPSWKKFNELLSCYKGHKAIEILRDSFNEEVGFSRIKEISIEDSPIEVGDIGALNGNRFISNGIGAHNSIGWGKSFFMSGGLVYNVYRLSCLKEPQKYFKLSPASKLSVMIISITEKQAKSNMFFNVKEMIKKIPYFRENFMFDVKKSTESLIFPNNIELFSGTSAQSSTIGLNIYAASLDEANFFKVITQSKRARSSDGEYDEALVLYNSLLRRQESRFLKEGLTPGQLYLGSSSVYPNDFTAQRVKIAKETNDRTTYMMNYNLWTVNRERYSKEEFKVELGGLSKRNRILEGFETDVTGEVISVPIDFLDKFKKDLDNAIRDIAGIALYSIQPFFGEREKIHEMFDSSMERIFSVDRATLSPKSEYIVTEKILRHDIKFKDRPRYIAMDIGLKKDKFGFAMGYIEDLKNVETEVYNEMTGAFEKITVKRPIVALELLLTVYPEKEFGEVELSRVRTLIFNLRKFGYKIRYASADGFQSSDMQQILRRYGIQFEYISMDKTTEPYETFRSAVYENRVRSIYHPLLEDEMVRLEKDYVNDMVNHPKQFSKDLADAAGQLVYNCHVNMKFHDDSLLPLNTTFEEDKSEKSLDDILKDFNDWVREKKVNKK